MDGNTKEDSLGVLGLTRASLGAIFLLMPHLILFWHAFNSLCAASTLSCGTMRSFASDTALVAFAYTNGTL